MGQQRRKSTFTWMGLICLHQLVVQGAEGSVGQNIQYPQVRFPDYLLQLLLPFSNTKAYFCALPPLRALFALFRPNSGQIISLLARDASGTVHI